MNKENWEVIDEVSGDLQAEMLRGLLEAQGIQVWLSQEGAGKAFGLTLPGLGLVQILVPSHQTEQARTLLDSYYAGELEGVEFDPEAADAMDFETEEENNEEGMNDDNS